MADQLYFALCAATKAVTRTYRLLLGGAWVGSTASCGAVDVLADRLYDNVSANQNPNVSAVHQMRGHAGSTFLVTAWSVKQADGPACYPGRDMREFVVVQGGGHQRITTCSGCGDEDGRLSNAGFIRAREASSSRSADRAQ